MHIVFASIIQFELVLEDSFFVQLAIQNVLYMFLTPGFYGGYPRVFKEGMIKMLGRPSGAPSGHSITSSCEHRLVIHLVDVLQSKLLMISICVQHDTYRIRPPPVVETTHGSVLPQI